MGLILVLGGLAWTYKDKFLEYIRRKTTDSRGRGVGRKLGNFDYKQNSRGSTYRKRRMSDPGLRVDIGKLVAGLVPAGITLIVAFTVVSKVKESLFEDPAMNITSTASGQALESAFGVFPVVIVVIVLATVANLLIRPFRPFG